MILFVKKKKRQVWQSISKTNCSKKELSFFKKTSCFLFFVVTKKTPAPKFVGIALQICKLLYFTFSFHQEERMLFLTR